jgi:hypothetical protein
VLSPDAKKTKKKVDRQKYHHNKGACNVECISEWNVPMRSNKKKRAADCGVIMETNTTIQARIDFEKILPQSY